jgi:probable phosphomutase (TIGR03848 family)
MEHRMTVFLLIRHATNDWVKTGRLAGWTPNVHLNEAGRTQSAALGKRLASAPLAAIYASPLERTMETAEAIAIHHPRLSVQPLEAVGEIDFGEWQGARLSKLRRQKLWQTVQLYPSRAQFPRGETFREAQARAVNALEALAAQHKDQQVAVVSHSDIIRLIVAHYLGAHLDFFQRIAIAPASLTIIGLGTDRPFVTCVNDTSHAPPALPEARKAGLWQRARAILSSYC